jgi:hypothetical protein
VVVVGVSDGVVVLTTGGAVVVVELSTGAELVIAGDSVVDGVVITIVDLLKVGG